MDCKLIHVNPDRTTYDCGTFIRKNISNGINCNHTQEEILRNAEYLNNCFGFKYFLDVNVNEKEIIVDIAKLQPSKFTHDGHESLEEVLEMLKIFLDINLKMFPYCNTDVHPYHVYMHNNKHVLIDWDDALLGHTHTPYYIMAEIYKECCVSVRRKYSADYKEFLQSNTKNTCLEITEDQWNKIVSSTEKLEDESEIDLGNLLDNNQQI